MREERFTVEKDGFYGTYYTDAKDTKCAFIGLFGDDSNDFMAKCGAKWFLDRNINAMCMSPGKKDYSHVNLPIERIEKAIEWLRKNGMEKIGIMGLSTAGMESLVAASLIPDITFTVGLTASDFVWQGFRQGNRDGCKEWPIPGASTLSWRGEPLPYMPFVYEHPVYWQKVQEETKGSGDFERTVCLFRDSEKDREHPEQEMIKIENIKGKLFLFGADDDSLWEAGKYVRRMDERLKRLEHSCDYVAVAYEHGTHFVLPESLLRKALPIGLKCVMKLLFKAAREYPDECERTRKDIDSRLTAALAEWNII